MPQARLFLIASYPSRSTGGSAFPKAPSVDAKIDRTHRHADGHEQRFWKIWVYKTIQKMRQKRSTVCLRSWIPIKELFGHCQGAGQRRQFHYYSPTQRKDVERREQYSATGPGSSENDPEYPQQMDCEYQAGHGFHTVWMFAQPGPLERLKSSPDVVSFGLQTAYCPTTAAAFSLNNDPSLI